MNPTRTKIFVIFAWVGISIFNAGPALSSNFNIEKKTVQKILYALDKNQWSKALVLSDNLDDPILTTYVNWVKLLKGFGSFEDYVAFLKKYDLTNIIFDRYFSNLLKKTVSGARNIAIIALKNGIPTPTLSSALNFFDAITTTNLPSNLIQAQRDYFGAHTYQRRDKSNDNFFHTDWTGLSGFVSSSNYNI